MTKTISIFLFLFFSISGHTQNDLYFIYKNVYNTDYPLERQSVVKYNETHNSAVYKEIMSSTKHQTALNQITQEENNITVRTPYADSYLTNNSGTINFTKKYGLNTIVSVADSVSFQWQLTNEKKVINGYECYKAQSNFRGRKWEAWYCPKIAVNYGPWKFWGLPGLIFEVSDTNKIYNFFLTKIEKQLDMNIEYPNLYKQITLKELILNEEYEGVLDNLDRNVEVEVNFVRKTPELIYEWEEEQKK